MELTIRTDIEDELRKLGWTNENYPGCSNIKVFETYITSNKPNPEKPWWITVYCKLPVWEWDFVQVWKSHGYRRVFDYPLREQEYIPNDRVDYDFENRPDARETAEFFTKERNLNFDEDSFEFPATYGYVAIQRVSERP